MIIPVWKKIGESTHLLAQRVGVKTADKTKNPDDAKATHTGTLDPMAEGIVVVLTEKDRYKKGKFSDWKKTYEFEIMLGVSTDSLDILGLQTDLTKNPINEKEIKGKIQRIIPSFLGKQKQKQPKFSAQRVSGKSAFDLAKQKQAFEVKENKIEIFSIKILGSYSLTLKKLETIINQKLSLIEGDFRQKEILKNWNETFKQLQNSKETNSYKEVNLPIIKLEVTVSKRTYIRSLVRDLSKSLGIPITTFSITRTKEGEYKKDNCLT